MSFLENRSFVIDRTRLVWGVLWFLVILVTFKDTLTGYPFGTGIQLRYFDDVLVLFLVFLILSDILRRKKTPKVQMGFLLLFFILFIFSIIQHLVVKSSFTANNFFFTFRDNFWYFPIFYILSLKGNRLSKKNLDQVINFFLATQIGFFLLSQLYHIIIHQSILLEDDVNGSLGANTSHVISYLLVLFIPYCLRERKWIFLIGIISILITASARSMYLFFFVSAILIFMRRMELFSLLRGAIIFLVLAYPLYYYFSNFTGFTLNPRILYNIQNVDLEEGQGAARISFLIYSTGKVIDNKKNFFLGHGSASYASRSGKVLGGHLYREYKRDFPFPNEFISGGSTFNPWIVELGVIGTSIMILVLLYLYRLCPKNRLILICFLTVLLGLTTQKLLEEYSFGFFIWFMLFYYRKSESLKAIPISAEK